MKIFRRVLGGHYRDSVALLRLSSRLTELPGVERAAVLMGTEANKSLFAQAGLLGGEIPGAGPNDLCVAVRYAPPADAAGIEAAVTGALAEQAAGGRPSGAGGFRPRSLRAARDGTAGGPAIAVVSVPGPFAAAEAGKALHLGMDVFLFSNGVSVEDEVACKRLGARTGRLVMGPDAGTALLDGLPLGFCNAWPAGPVGIVAASGTGAQEVACQLARAGCGVRAIVGVGSRDLSAEVGGLSFREGLRRLSADPGVEVVLLVAKPPDPEVLAALAPELAALDRPCVALFLGRGGPAPAGGRPPLPPPVVVASDTDEAARAVLARGPVPAGGLAAADRERAAAGARGLRRGRRWVRGLFSGGTLAKQAALLIPGCAEAGVPAAAAADPRGAAVASLVPPGHRVLDMGEDAFTVGRPHPIVDPELRARVLREVAALPDTAAVLFDVVLGGLAHPDPAGVLAEAVAASPGPVYVASVCGTEADAQGYAAQCARLRQAGVLVAGTSPEAARLAAAVAAGVA